MTNENTDCYELLIQRHYPLLHSASFLQAWSSQDRANSPPREVHIVFKQLQHEAMQQFRRLSEEARRADVSGAQAIALLSLAQWRAVPFVNPTIGVGTSSIGCSKLHGAAGVPQ